MKWYLVFFIFLMPDSLLAKDNNEIRFLQQNNLKLQEEVKRLKKWHTIAMKNQRENIAFKKSLNTTTDNINIIKTTTVTSQTKELEIFADKYLETFQDKLSYKKFRMVLDVDNSEIVIDQKYGTFKYIFEEYYIDDGEMIIEKGFDKIFFQLVSDEGNPLFSLNYKITFD